MTPKEKYDLFLLCDCWRLVTRPAALERANYVCELRLRCKGARAREVHHWTYESVGMEGPDDVAATCAACHRALHGIPEPTKLPKPANDNNAQLLLDLFASGADKREAS